ncbi:uncharacterized protein [Arachis hypogaea]|uniref:uncharacterized protein n=1 Tax=Arachis hypogaea TaxID=3818 RepID=UPI003B21FDB0
MKKNGKLRVCIDFLDQDNATLKDEYFIPLADMLIDSTAAKAVKGQVIADFLVDRPNNPNEQGTNIVDVVSDCWKLHFDGSKHKSGAKVGILIISPEGSLSEFLFELKYHCSNNVADYETLILGLKIFVAKGVLDIQILGDSQLILKQLSKEFKCNNKKLQKYLSIA